MRKLTPHLTYANVMVTLLAIGALTGGVAYAANTIRSTDIVNGEVKSVDVGNNQVQSIDVRDDALAGGGLTSADLQANSVGGTEVQGNSIDGSEIIEESLNGDQIANDTLTHADIADGQLNDEDISSATFVGFNATVGLVPAHSCVGGIISGLGDVNGDHMLLTPDAVGADFNLEYTVQYFSVGTDEARLRTCNPTDDPINDGNTRFNLLVIDAQ